MEVIMKRLILSLTAGILSFALIALPAAAQSAPAAEVALSFTGGAVWTSQTTGICIWYFPVLRDQPLESLFAPGADGKPAIDRQHAYLLWVSDFSVVPLPEAKEPFAAALVPSGTATIYYKADATSRDFSDLSNRTSWGTPVAQFVRKAAVIRSPDSWDSDTFVFSASLVSTENFQMGGSRFDLRTVIPNGMTCWENGQRGSSWEAGSCVATGQSAVFSAALAAGNMVPIKGVMAGTQQTPRPDTRCPATHPLLVPVTGSGTLSQLGTVAMEQSHCINTTGTDFSFAEGRFTFTAPNGDSVSGTYAGALKATANPQVMEIVGTALFNAGAGRFRGVTGTALASGFVDLATQNAELILDGAMTAAGRQ